MNRLDRTLGLLLLLRGGRVVTATELAARFEVSVRTVYRDIEAMSGLGVPISADMGRTGGFRLREGYFLPPVTLGTEEAVSLLLGLILMRRLRVAPFPKEAEFAERKLLAALPPETRKAIERASRIIGFEKVPPDLLHPELGDPQVAKNRGPNASGSASESGILGAYLRALLARSRVMLTYSSPYREKEAPREVEPLGMIWDRDRWYLVGRSGDARQARRTWRADRVLAIAPGRSMPPVESDFDVGKHLDRKWLREVMDTWRAESPVRIAMGPEQAERLSRDWFYGNAIFEPGADGRLVMVYGEHRPEVVVELLRWLGPGAELLEPREWRRIIVAGLREMLASYKG
jgi:predicted DNA-binding transcriptional regulator YafY